MAITSTSYPQANLPSTGTKPSVYEGIILVGSDETPMLKAMGTSAVTNTSHSWVIDKIGDPERTPENEISSLNTTQVNHKQNNSNAVEIFKTELFVSKTMTQIKAYGGNELEHEVAKKAKEHKKLLEQMILGLNRDNDPKISLLKEPIHRSENQPGEAAGMFYFVAKDETTFTNGKKGNITAYDSSKDWTGTKSTMDWNKFNTILQQTYNAGETVKDVFVGTTLKARINSFVNRNYSDQTTYVGRLVALETDFGTVNIHLSRFMNQENALDDTIIAGNFDYAKVGLLYPTELAEVHTDKTGVAKRYYTEATLELRNADAFSIGVGLK